MFAKYVGTYEIAIPPHTKGRFVNYHLNEEQLLKDGYLPVVESKEPEQPELYIKRYAVKDDRIVMTYQKKNVIK